MSARKSLGRWTFAVVVGERSAGIYVTAGVMQLPNGGVLMYSVAQTRTADGKVLEGNGVTPNIPVSLDPSQLLQGRDAQMQAAIQAISETKQ